MTGKGFEGWVSEKNLTLGKCKLVFISQGVWCGCLADGSLTGPPYEASGINPRWEPDACRFLTGTCRAFFLKHKRLLTSMLEVPFACEDHSDAVFVGGGDDLVILF